MPEPNTAGTAPKAWITLNFPACPYSSRAANRSRGSCRRCPIGWSWPIGPPRGEGLACAPSAEHTPRRQESLTLPAHDPRPIHPTAPQGTESFTSAGGERHFETFPFGETWPVSRIDIYATGGPEVDGRPDYPALKIGDLEVIGETVVDRTFSRVRCSHRVGRRCLEKRGFPSKNGHLPGGSPRPKRGGHSRAWARGERIGSVRAGAASALVPGQEMDRASSSGERLMLASRSRRTPRVPGQLPRG